jgi:hypothetical protein
MTFSLPFPCANSEPYSQDPASVREWVDTISAKWDFERVIPAHWDGPIDTNVEQFRAAFTFLENPEVDPFPEPDMRRGLQPIADLVITKKAWADALLTGGERQGNVTCVA